MSGSRLARKPVVLLLSVVGALAVLVASRLTWVTGRVVGVAGEIPARVTGSDAAPGLVGLALVGLAAAVAAVTSGRVGRMIAAGALVLVPVVIAGLAIRVGADPGAVLLSSAAEGSAVTGGASPTGWVLAGGLAGSPFALAGLAVLRAGRRWSALGESPDGARSETSATTRTRSDWDRVSEGEDPTTTDG